MESNSTPSPTISYSRVAALPGLVRSFCYNNDAWIVGSGALYLLGGTDSHPRDWDVLVPLWDWPRACRTVPEGTRTNSFGGLKLELDGLAIDVWGGDIGTFLLQAPERYMPGYAVHPKGMRFLCVRNDVRRRDD